MTFSSSTMRLTFFFYWTLKKKKKKSFLLGHPRVNLSGLCPYARKMNGIPISLSSTSIVNMRSVSTLMWALQSSEDSCVKVQPHRTTMAVVLFCLSMSNAVCVCVCVCVCVSVCVSVCVYACLHLTTTSDNLLFRKPLKIPSTLRVVIFCNKTKPKFPLVV